MYASVNWGIIGLGWKIVISFFAYVIFKIVAILHRPQCLDETNRQWSKVEITEIAIPYGRGLIRHP